MEKEDLHTRSADAPESSGATRKVSAHWHVLTSSEPQKIYEQLTEINEANPDKAGIEFYIPFVAFQNFSITDEHIQRNYATLRRFVFIRLTRRRIDLLRRAHRWTLFHLGYSRDHADRPLLVRDAEMRAFMALCSDVRIDYEIWPTLEGLELNEEVTLLTTPFAGWKARIIECRTTRTGNAFTIGLDIMGSTKLLRLKNLKETDFQRHYSPDRQKQEYRLVEWVKSAVKQSVDASVSAEPIDEKRRKTLDANLQKVWGYRRSVITSPTARRHLLAMLLVTAVLRKDDKEADILRYQAEEELRTLEADPKQKRPTDTWAILQVALFFATKHPKHRTAAKEYERRYLPKSAFLHSMIQIIRRFEI